MGTRMADEGVALRAKGRRKRKDRGFDAAVGAYAALMIVGCAGAIVSHRLGESAYQGFQIVTAITAGAGAAFVLGAKHPWRSRLVAGVPLLLIALFLGAAALGLVRFGFHNFTAP